MKTLRICVYVFLAALLTPVHSFGQHAAWTANRKLDIQVGVEGSTFSLDYGEGREEGLGAYADCDFSFWHLGVEALYRNASIITPHDTGENHLMIGPRFHIEKGRFAPYAKVLVGRGTINYQQGYNATAYSQSYGAIAFGGGLDVHLATHITLRAIDFEAQSWPGFPPHGLSPNGISVGVAYRL